MTKTFDFDKIEQLRERLDLRQQDMADLFGVSRVQYNKWVNHFRAGETIRIRDVNLKRIRDSLDAVVWVLRTHGWPTQAAEQLEPTAKLRELKWLMSQQP